jgi:DNA-directed RNA polymerase specialized sigma24 family protein
MLPLTRVKRAQQRRASATQEYRDAIRAAHTAGHTLREIAEAAGVSHVAVLKTLRDA